MIFNIVSGGAKFATIAVTYPTGTTVTCAQSPYSFTVSEGTSHSFDVPKSGEWTLTVSKGNISTTTTVNVTTYGETYSETLHIYHYFFKEGEGAIVPLTVQKTGDGGATIGTDTISLNRGVNNRTQISSTSAVDVTGYTYLKMEIAAASYDSTHTVNDQLAIATEVKTASWKPEQYAASYQYLMVPTTRTVFTIDISSLSGSYYPIYQHDTTWTQSIYNLWLEA